MFRDIKNNFFTSNLPVSSFTSDRGHFLGDYEYGSWANPLSLQQPELDNYEAQRGHNVGALMHHLGELQPGETRRLITQLGQAESVMGNAVDQRDALHPPIPRSRAGGRSPGRNGRLLGRFPRPPAGAHARPGDERDAQHPQPAPDVHHAQLVALPFAVPGGPGRARHRLPR